MENIDKGETSRRYMSGTPTCDHCGKVGPAGARSMGPRCANHDNPPADHSHWAMMTGGGAVYDDGCYNCGAEWAHKVMTNVSDNISTFSMFNGMWTEYERYTTGKTSHKSKDMVPSHVRDVVAGAWPSGAMKVVCVCDDCPVPAAVKGYCPSQDEFDYMMSWVYDYADWMKSGRRGTAPADPY